ncbi:hypothetical protein LCGC14_1904770 [marine sediment metagenome]|uniref:Uncharacterized protein n=1 Tax=marine sediment metagenome TaxID=412755 RepID=A0A0F9GIT3_9ZZZZ
MAKKTQTATLKKNKVCKSCVRFRNEKDDKTTTSIYIQNAEYEELGKPDTIKLSVEAV